MIHVGIFFPFWAKKGGNFPFFIRILTSHNLLILYEIGIKLSTLPHLKLPSRSSWWQPKRGENISEGPWKQGFMNESLMQSILSRTHSPLWCTSSPSPSCWIHHFPYDMFIPACKKVKITKNHEGFVVSTKRKFF